MTLTDKLKGLGENVKNIIVPTAVLTGVYAGLTAAVFAVSVPVYTAYEGIGRLCGSEEVSVQTTITDKGISLLHNGGRLQWIEYIHNGKRVIATDSPAMLEGKFFSNTQTGNAKFGVKYNLRTIESPIGNTVVEMKPAE